MSSGTRPGSNGHPGDDGRSGPGNIHLGRGVALVIAAVVIGVIVLNSTSRGPVAPTSVTTTTLPSAPTTSASGGRGSSGVAGHPANQVRVLVANGSKVTGAAGRVTAVVAQTGYSALAPTNANTQIASTVVYYSPGYQTDAAAVARLFSLPDSSVQPMPGTPPVGDTKGANVVVVVGPDLANKTATPGSTTTTTPARR